MKPDTIPGWRNGPKAFTAEELSVIAKSIALAAEVVEQERSMTPKAREDLDRLASKVELMRRIQGQVEKR